MTEKATSEKIQLSKNNFLGRDAKVLPTIKVLTVRMKSPPSSCCFTWWLERKPSKTCSIISTFISMKVERIIFPTGL